MWGLIGGTGLNALPGLQPRGEASAQTVCGAASAAVQLGQLGAAQIAFLPRHGVGHRLAPHAINYRANLLALQAAGVSRLIGVAAVGGITPAMAPAELVLPHDIIDYTWGREHSYAGVQPLQHVEFCPPYADELRRQLLDTAQALELPLQALAVHGVTQGPRLESAAEIGRLARDGCDIVGMTGMPEAALARELGIPYVCLAVVVNWAAGIGSGAIHAEIEQSIAAGMAKAQRLLSAVLNPD